MDRDGICPLLLSCQQGDTVFVEELWDWGEPAIPASWIAADASNVPVTRWLLDQGHFQWNQRGPDSTTPLLLVLFHNRPDMVELLQGEAARGRVPAPPRSTLEAHVELTLEMQGATKISEWLQTLSVEPDPDVSRGIHFEESSDLKRRSVKFPRFNEASEKRMAFRDYDPGKYTTRLCLGALRGADGKVLTRVPGMIEAAARSESGWPERCQGPHCHQGSER